MDTYYDASRDILVDGSINRLKGIHHIQVPIRINVRVMTVIGVTNVRIKIGKFLHVMTRQHHTSLSVYELEGSRYSSVCVMVIIYHYRCITILYLLGCILFNDAVTNPDYTASTDLKLMYDE